MSWNKPSSAPQPPKKSAPPALKRGLLAGLFVVALGALGLYLFSNGEADSRPLQKKDRGRIKEVAPAAVRPATVKTVAAKSAVLPEQAPSERASAENAAATTDSATADSATPAADKPKRKPIFKNGTDQLIFLAVFASKGSSIPPLPKMSPADTQRYIDSLRSPIEIEEDDPPQVQEMKKGVNEVRQQIADIIVKEPDRDLSEILNAHREDFNNRIDLRADAQKTYDKFIAEGDAEGAAAYLEKANEFLVDYGIDPIGQESDEEDPQN